MIKNIEKKRDTGSISETGDVSYRKSIRDYLRQVDLKNPFAITLTMNTVKWMSHSRNFRHFMNRLNQSYLQNSYRKYGNRLTVIPVKEENSTVRPHYHCVIDNPFPERDREFVNLVKTCWKETVLGQGQIDIQRMVDFGWIDYMTKLEKKGNIADSIDWENMVVPLRGRYI